MTCKKYHIIGGGIAGLTAAKYVRKYNPQAEIVLYEAAGNLGGKCKSYYDPVLQSNVDTAIHAILKCNKEACKITGKLKFQNSFLFYDAQTGKFSHSILKNLKDIVLALFNLPSELVSRPILKTTLQQMFPFWNVKKVYFTENVTNEKIINQHIQYPDKICYHYVLKDVRGKRGRATKLVFNKETILLTEKDIVISAIDIHNFSRIFKTKEPEYNKIINIHYRTSTPLTLPESRSFIAVTNGLSQWIFINGNILSVIISHADKIDLHKEELAREVWKEVCTLRKVKAAFVPPHRVLTYHRATLRQDDKNNQLRPLDCLTQYENFYLAGDWTMRDWPCSLEAAAQSGKRAALAAK